MTPRNGKMASVSGTSGAFVPSPCSVVVVGSGVAGGNSTASNRSLLSALAAKDFPRIDVRISLSHYHAGVGEMLEGNALGFYRDINQRCDRAFQGWGMSCRPKFI